MCRSGDCAELSGGLVEGIVVLCDVQGRQGSSALALCHTYKFDGMHINPASLTVCSASAI